MHGSLPTTSSPDDVRVAPLIGGTLRAKGATLFEKKPHNRGFFYVCNFGCRRGLRLVSVVDAVCVWFRLWARSAPGFGCRRSRRGRGRGLVGLLLVDEAGLMRALLFRLRSRGGAPCTCLGV